MTRRSKYTAPCRQTRTGCRQPAPVGQSTWSAFSLSSLLITTLYGFVWMEKSIACVAAWSRFHFPFDDVTIGGDGCTKESHKNECENQNVKNWTPLMRQQIVRIAFLAEGSKHVGADGEQLHGSAAMWGKAKKFGHVRALSR